MFRVTVRNEFIILHDGEEELAYWDREEWREYPDILPAIANAITIGFTQGADAVRALLDKHFPEGKQ